MISVGINGKPGEFFEDYRKSHYSTRKNLNILLFCIKLEDLKSALFDYNKRKQYPSQHDTLGIVFLKQHLKKFKQHTSLIAFNTLLCIPLRGGSKTAITFFAFLAEKKFNFHLFLWRFTKRLDW